MDTLGFGAAGKIDPIQQVPIILLGGLSVNDLPREDRGFSMNPDRR